ncbi:MAG: transcriptional repressor, partial [Phycisphaerales bacterium]|nr:transcriptional repressor [Phycisphaerales bacterium]
DARAKARDLLHAAQQRVTPARVEVIALLAASREALDASTVADRLQHASPQGTTIDRVTIYRTLTTLVDAGLAHRIDAGDRVFRYSLTDHSNCDHDHHRHEHPHIVCDACGTVECLTDAQVIIKTSTTSPSLSQRFRVRAQEVTLRGTCDRCDQPPPRKAQ